MKLHWQRQSNRSAGSVLPILGSLLAFAILHTDVASRAVAAELLGGEALASLHELPQYRSSIRLGSVSSYDRTGGNDDGFSGKYSYLRKEDGGLVLADLTGPGIIHRIWTPTPSDDWLEFYLDGETHPRLRIRFRDLFLGQHPRFPAPLSGYGAGGFYTYVPIPFAKSCKILARAERVQFYQINFSIYPPATRVRTFAAAPDPEVVGQLARAADTLAATGTDLSARVALPGSAIEIARADVTVVPGGAVTVFDSRKPGRITGLRLSPATALADKTRGLVLRISFDDGPPTVLCPAGDFFGYAWGEPAMKSLLVGVSDDVAYSYFPMPYKRSARIELVSEGTGGSPLKLHAEVSTTVGARQPDEGQFHALWRRENPTRDGEPFTFVDFAGRGHLVGFVQQAQGIESGKTLFFEGDDQTTIDGDLVVHGTGSEDFYNGGWYDVPDRWEKRLSFALSGCLGYQKPLGRTGGYRLLLGDAYAFREHVRQTIEHGGNNNDEAADYCGLTYFYAEPSSGLGIGLPAVAERGVNDPLEMAFPAWWQTPIHAWCFQNATLSRESARIGDTDVRYLSLRAAGQDWFGPPFLSLTCAVPATGDYEILLAAVQGPEQAQVQLFRDEEPVGAAVELYAPEPRKSGRLALGTLRLEAGGNNLMFKLVGRHAEARGWGLDLIEVVCRRQE
ncbi:MAG: DUF2961 domain-containing protein [Verrucomicrobiales bacterium]|nr:DUF2961 domain-containing protein [Verrucomicrobiales bacterium]